MLVQSVMQPSNQPVVVTEEVLQSLYLMMQMRQILQERNSLGLSALLF